MTRFRLMVDGRDVRRLRRWNRIQEFALAFLLGALLVLLTEYLG